MHQSLWEVESLSKSKKLARIKAWSEIERKEERQRSKDGKSIRRRKGSEIHRRSQRRRQLLLFSRCKERRGERIFLCFQRFFWLTSLPSIWFPGCLFPSRTVLPLKPDQHCHRHPISWFTFNLIECDSRSLWVAHKTRDLIHFEWQTEIQRQRRRLLQKTPWISPLPYFVARTFPRRVLETLISIPPSRIVHVSRLSSMLEGQ